MDLMQLARTRHTTLAKARCSQLRANIKALLSEADQLDVATLQARLSDYYEELFNIEYLDKTVETLTKNK